MAYTFAIAGMREPRRPTTQNGDSVATPGPSARPGRRRILQGAFAALALGASTIAFVRTRGYDAGGRRLLALGTWQFVVVQHAARRIALPDRPGDPAIPSTDDVDVAGFVDAWVARMPDKLRTDFGRFLAYLEHLAPLGHGHAARFTRLPADTQDGVLASLEASPSDLLRAGFDGLKSLVFFGYYRDPRTWGILGYDGPLVGRPTPGWGEAASP